MNHTDTLWTLKEGHKHIIVISQKPLRYIIVNGIDAEENARRIVACVNACAGLSIEGLESPLFVLTDVARDIQYLSFRYGKALEQRDELLELIKRHLCDNPEAKSLYCQCDLCKETRILISKIEANK